MRKQKEEVDVVQFKIPVKQKRILEEAARDMGLSLSAWLRMIALKAARDQRASGTGK
jgi:hypothetical protein